jgi:hypothetical protein
LKNIIEINLLIYYLILKYSRFWKGKNIDKKDGNINLNDKKFNKFNE